MINSAPNITDMDDDTNEVPKETKQPDNETMNKEMEDDLSNDSSTVDPEQIAKFKDEQKKEEEEEEEAAAKKANEIRKAQETNETKEAKPTKQQKEVTFSEVKKDEINPEIMHENLSMCVILDKFLFIVFSKYEIILDKWMFEIQIVKQYLDELSDSGDTEKSRLINQIKNDVHNIVQDIAKLRRNIKQQQQQSASLKKVELDTESDSEMKKG